MYVFLWRLSIMNKSTPRITIIRRHNFFVSFSRNFNFLSSTDVKLWFYACVAPKANHKMFIEWQSQASEIKMENLENGNSIISTDFERTNRVKMLIDKLKSIHCQWKSNWIEKWSDKRRDADYFDSIGTQRQNKPEKVLTTKLKMSRATFCFVMISIRFHRTTHESKSKNLHWRLDRDSSILRLAVVSLLPWWKICFRVVAADKRVTRTSIRWMMYRSTYDEKKKEKEKARSRPTHKITPIGTERVRWKTQRQRIIKRRHESKKKSFDKRTNEPTEKISVSATRKTEGHQFPSVHDDDGEAEDARLTSIYDQRFPSSLFSLFASHFSSTILLTSTQ